MSLKEKIKMSDEEIDVVVIVAPVKNEAELVESSEYVSVKLSYIKNPLVVKLKIFLTSPFLKKTIPIQNYFLRVIQIFLKVVKMTLKS
jgi:hypothetical protein